MIMHRFYQHFGNSSILFEHLLCGPSKSEKLCSPHHFRCFSALSKGLPKTKNADVVETLKKLIMGEVVVAEVIKR